MSTITANELKTKGVSVFESHLQEEDEVIITVRGQDKYVVMELAQYEKYREYELEIAIQQVKADLAAGQYVKESVAEHMDRVTNDV